MLKKLAVHVSNYSAGNLLVTVSGLLTFPILTRIFTVQEYGTLNLISATLTLLLGIAKLGVQNSIVRFHGEVKSHGGAAALEEYRSTTLFGMLAIATAVTILWIVISQIIPASWWGDPHVTALMLLTSGLVIIRTCDSCLTNFLRAEERSGLFSAYSVLKKYGVVAAVLLTFLYVSRNLYGFYSATIVAEGGAALILLAVVGRRGSYSVTLVSRDLFRKMLMFGVPMIAFELAGITLNIGDRYVIQGLLGSGPLGVYSAGYNFCEYVQVVMLIPISQAIMPMYVRCWEERGERETTRFVENSLHYYVMLALPVVAGLAAVGGPVVVLLASQKYAESAAVIPWVVAGMAIDAGVTIVGAGLYIRKRTAVFAALAAGCAVLNVVLNLILVPHLGIVGAAVATFVSYAILGLTALRASSRLVPLAFPWASAVKFGTLAALMYLIVSRWPGGSGVIGLAGRVAAGVLSYGAMVMVCDRPARSAARLGLGWCYAKRAALR